MRFVISKEKSRTIEYIFSLIGFSIIIFGPGFLKATNTALEPQIQIVGILVLMIGFNFYMNNSIKLLFMRIQKIEEEMKELRRKINDLEKSK